MASEGNQAIGQRQLMPAVSAYIPCYNEAATIAQTIASVKAQSLPVDEIFVVDDGSSDDSGAVAASLGVRVIRQSPNLGRGAVRARAMQEARHDLVLCLDGASVIAPNFLSQAIGWFEAPEVAAVFGHITQKPGKSITERWRSRHLYKVSANNRTSRKALLATGAALARKSIVLSVGNFDSSLRQSEDADLGVRLLQAGFDVVFDERLAVQSLPQDNVFTLLERYWRWHASSVTVVSWRSYAKQIVYCLKCMVPQDLEERDLGSLFITLVVPHYQFWRSWHGNFGNLQVFSRMRKLEK